MEHNLTQRDWEAYAKSECSRIEPLVRTLGFALEAKQPHTTGERYLMSHPRDVGGGGKKLVLVGTREKDGVRVVIKASSDREGQQEIERERTCRTTLKSIDFAYRPFLAPEEMVFARVESHLIFITRYIKQDLPFVERSLEEQFFLSLRAFKMQEGLHATTYKHVRRIRATFGEVDAPYYRDSFSRFGERLGAAKKAKLSDALNRAQALLEERQRVLEQYCGFLTHADFSPQNLRIQDDTIYLLDYASIHFGNKYESWGRFLNFMALYNPGLEKLLTEYVRANRTEEELVCLRTMRAYKLGFLISFYAQATRESGPIQALSEKRVAFWGSVLEAVLQERQLDPSVIEAYKRERDALRSEDEKERQKDLH